MKKLILIILASFAALGLNAQEIVETEETKSKFLDMTKNNGSTLGTRFVLGFPPNENETFGTQSLAVYIAAPEETEVRLYTDEGLFNTFVIPRQEVALVSSADVNDPRAYDFSWAFENWRNETPMKGRSLIVESDLPVSIYVLNSKPTSTEGYLAIPVASWGKKYIHNSFWDFAEGRNWGGGFQVLASEDNTRITISLKGKGQSVGETTGGKRIGDVINVTLDEGEVYQVQGNGRTRGIFDLSGSEIVSNKPVGVLSYHNRAMIPKFIVPTGRDHLLSMMPPVQAWGKRYATVELDRGTGRGDYFRVVASEDNTNVEFAWYDIVSRQLTKKETVVLRANQVWSPYNIDGANGDGNDLTGINGTMIIEADKPILVMQYAYSAGWDSNGGEFDPFMFPVTAVEQFTNATVFQSPQNYSGGLQEYQNNFFNLLYLGDNIDKERHRALVESIEIDGRSLPEWDGQAGLNFIPGTNIYYSRLSVTPGIHRIIADTPFGGYIYGFSNYETYAWPAATNYLNLSQLDPWAPVVEWEKECDIFYFDVTDMKPDLLVGDTTYVDVGLNSRAEILTNINFRDAPEDIVRVDKETREELEFAPGVALDEYSWRYQVLDPYQDATLELRWKDAWVIPAPNDTIVTVEYIADKIEFTDQALLDFGQVRVGESLTREFQIEITNENLEDFSGIPDGGIYLRKGSEFVIEISPLEDRILPVSITYTPIMEYTELEDDDRYDNEPMRFDFDTLFIETNCLVWNFEMEGQGILPQLRARDWVGNQTNPGVTLTYRRDNSPNYLLSNAGTMMTDVTGIIEIYEVDGNRQRTSGNLIDAVAPLTDWGDLNTYVPEYTITPANGPAIDFDIAARDNNTDDPGLVNIGGLTFLSNASGDFNYEIVFEHNASDKELKESAFWMTTVTNSQLTTTDLNWPMVRVESYNDGTNQTDAIQDAEGNNVETNGFVMLENAGSAALRIYSIRLLDNADGHFDFDINYGPNGDDDSRNRWTGSPASDNDINWVNFKRLYDPNNGQGGSNYVLQGEQATTAYIPFIFNPQNTADARNGEELTATVEFWGTMKNEAIGPNNPLEKLGQSRLSGRAFLPTITINEITFPGRTKQGERSDYEEAEITISTDYDVRELTVFGLKDENGRLIGGVDADDFGYADFGDVTDPNDNTVPFDPTTLFPGGQAVVTPGQPITMSVYFEPNVKPRTLREAIYTVLSDAKPSEDDANNRAEYNVDNIINRTQPAEETQETITAEAFTVGVDAELTFEGGQIDGRAETTETTKCDPVTGTIVLENTDATSRIVLSDDEPVLQFDLTNPALNVADYNFDVAFTMTGYDPGLELDGVGTETVNIVFDPSQLPDELAGEEIVVSVIANFQSEGSGGMMEDGQFIINEWTLMFTLTDFLIDIPNIEEDFEPGEPEIPIDIQVSSSDWVGANVTEIQFDFVYNANMFNMDRDAAFDDAYLPNGWTYDVPNIAQGADPRFQIVTVRATGANPWPANRAIFNPRFTLLINDGWIKDTGNGNSDEFADERDFYIGENISLGDRGICIFEESENGRVGATYCSPQNLNVEQRDGAGMTGAMSSISPNPVKEEFELNYTVPMSGLVQVAIIDGTGKVVSVPVLEKQVAGEYSTTINVDALSSGTYQLVLQSARYTTAQPLNIVK
jgi:hypothetical protein